MNISDNSILSLLVSGLSLLVSGFAVYVAFTRGEKSLQSTAADRALQRFNRVNELLLEKPGLNKVFKERYVSLKTDMESKTFIWYLFNQLEGTFLDNKLGVLKKEYFKSYDEWLNQVISEPNALRDFLERGEENPKIRDSFSDSYWQYLRQKVERHGPKGVGQLLPADHCTEGRVGGAGGQDPNQSLSSHK